MTESAAFWAERREIGHSMTITIIPSSIDVMYLTTAHHWYLGSSHIWPLSSPQRQTAAHHSSSKQTVLLAVMPLNTVAVLHKEEDVELVRRSSRHNKVEPHPDTVAEISQLRSRLAAFEGGLPPHQVTVQVGKTQAMRIQLDREKDET
jgi:hypothetical protein